MSLQKIDQSKRRHGLSLMQSSAFLLNDYLKKFDKEDYNRCSVEQTLKNLRKHIQSEWDLICKKPVFNKFPDYGDKMTAADWIECAKTGGFIDYDGSGTLATDKFESDIGISPSGITFFDLKLPMWATHVMWYNR